MKAILHRKNSLFYRTQYRADMGELWMSLIHPCELNQVNPFDYRTEVLRHPEVVAATPLSGCPGITKVTLAHLPVAAQSSVRSPPREPPNSPPPDRSPLGKNFCTLPPKDTNHRRLTSCCSEMIGYELFAKP